MPYGQIWSDTDCKDSWCAHNDHIQMGSKGNQGNKAKATHTQGDTQRLFPRFGYSSILGGKRMKKKTMKDLLNELAEIQREFGFEAQYNRLNNILNKQNHNNND